MYFSPNLTPIYIHPAYIMAVQDTIKQTLKNTEKADDLADDVEMLKNNAKKFGDGARE